MNDSNRSKPKASVEPKEPHWLGIVLKQPTLPLLLGIGAFLLTHTYSSVREGTKIREQATPGRPRPLRNPNHCPSKWWRQMQSAAKKP